HPALGCAIDLDNLEWACRSGRSADAQPVRVLVSGSSSAVAEMLGQLRANEVVAARAPGEGVVEYARAWRYSHVLKLSSTSASLLSVADGSTTNLDADASSVARKLAVQPR